MRPVSILALALIIAAPALAAPAAKKAATPTPAAKSARAAKPASAAKPAPAAKQAAAKQAAAKQAAAKQAPAAKQAAAKQAKTAAAPQAKRKAAKKAPKAPPKPSPEVIAAYAAMPAAERRAVQSDLVWTGDFNGIPSDEFGERSINAVKSYQARIGAAETGILTAEQRAALAATAKAKQESSGFQVVADPVSGVRLAVPVKRVGAASPTPRGTRWSSGRGEVQIETFRLAEPGTTLTAVFEREKKEPTNRRVEYNLLRDNFFVLSGLQGLKRFYLRAHAKDNEVRGMLILYDQAMQGIMDPIAVAMSSRFEPFPVAAAPPPRRKVEYATGIVIDATGHVITDRQAIDGCNVITLTGLGNAELLGETGELALLRVYGARSLSPVGFVGESRSGAEVTLVGIADPQQQGGNSGATVARARIGEAGGTARPLEPAPALGFSGAAALDGGGRLVGMVLAKTAVLAGPTYVVAQAQLVPAEDIRSFLTGRNIAPAATPSAGIEAAKASVVRVICVRK
jgi:Putative peptidoglycan binding domain